MDGTDAQGFGKSAAAMAANVERSSVAYRETCGKCGARRVDRQIGLEPTPDAFVATMVAVFREVRRVLRDDGTVWINLGDSYLAQQGAGFNANKRLHERNRNIRVKRPLGLKQKDLVGIPWMVAFALRADGWYLRSDIVWSKPNPMPESVTDRPTKAHEYVFLLSKGPRYAYDADAIREPHEDKNVVDGVYTNPKAIARPGYEPQTQGWNKADGQPGGMVTRHREYNPAGRNKRSVWTVATQPYAGAHFATFPPKLIEPCILAGAPERACGKCGAPWVRVTERVKHPTRDVEAQRAYYAERTGRTDGAISGPVGMVDDVRTVGFEPSCSHHGKGEHVPQESPEGRDFSRLGSSPDVSNACLATGEAGPQAQIVPGVVLDPFAGAGTTGLVALQHGREFVGIELNPEYARMARERIETAVRLGFRSPSSGPEQIPGQASIFDLDGAA